MGALVKFDREKNYLCPPVEKNCEDTNNMYEI